MKKLFYLLAVSFILFSCSKKEDEEILNKVEVFTPSLSSIQGEWVYVSGDGLSNYNDSYKGILSGSTLKTFNGVNNVDITVKYKTNTWSSKRYVIGNYSKDKLSFLNDSKNWLVQPCNDSLFFITENDMNYEIKYRIVKFARVK